MENAAKKKVLIVEDEKTLAHALSTRLEHEGFATSIAGNGKDGLREILSGAYDVVLLDLILPEMDGFGVLEALQKAQNKTPVIVLTNLGHDKDREKARSFGANEYLVKADTPIAVILRKIHDAL